MKETAWQESLHEPLPHTGAHKGQCLLLADSGHAAPRQLRIGFGPSKTRRMSKDQLSAPTSPATRRRHAFVAAVSGLLPAALALGVAAWLIPVEVRAYGNATLWGSTLVGSLLAAFWVISRKRTSVRSAVAIGALAVLVVLIASATWIEYQAGLQLEQVE